MARSTNDTIPFSDFRKMIESGQIVSVELGDTYFTGYGPSYSSYGSSSAVYKTAAILTEDFLQLLDEKGVTYRATVKQNNFLLEILLNWIVPIAFFLIMWRLIFKRMGGGLGGGLFSAGQSRPAAVEEGQVKTRFTDVAGVAHSTKGMSAS